MDYRIEHDTMGEIRVPADRCWGAQTQRSYENFAIGTEIMPEEIIRAFAVLKCAAARANFTLGKLPEDKKNAIAAAAARLLRAPGRTHRQGCQRRGRFSLGPHHSSTKLPCTHPRRTNISC